MKSDITKHIDILDLVNIVVTQPAKGRFAVDLQATDRTKNVIVDTDALNTLNEELTHRSKNLDPTDLKTYQFIEEFVGRMLSELYRCGLVELEDVKEAHDDPYHAVRRKI